MNLKYRPVRGEDLEPLLRLVPGIDPDPRSLAWTREQLAFSLSLQEASLQRGFTDYHFSHYARVAEQEGKVIGFVSGHLITQEQSKAITTEATKESWYRWRNREPLPDSALVHCSEDVCLLLTCFFWDASLPGRVELAFADQALERVTRYFEGHNICRVYATLLSKFEYLIAGLLAVTPLDAKRYTSLEEGFFLLELSGPYRTRGLFRDWASRLLREPVHTSRKDTLTVNQRRIGRVLHEYQFDYLAAVEAGALPTWSMKDAGTGRMQDSVTGYGGWSREVYARLNIQPGKRNTKLDALQRFLAEHADLLLP